MKQIDRAQIMKRVGRSLSLCAVVSCVLSPALAAAPGSRAGFHASVESGPGLYTVVFKTPRGRIRVNLPANGRAGEAVIGTILSEPKGRNEAERGDNRGKLNGYVLKLGDQVCPVRDPVLHWTLPAGRGGDLIPLALKDTHDDEMTHALLPVPTPSAGTTGTPAHAEAIRMPSNGTAGKPLVIPGPFDGSLQEIRVWMGGKEARILAVSPRSCVIESPREVLGKTTLQVKQGDLLLATGDFRNERMHRSSSWPYVALGVLAVGAYSIASSVNRLGEGLAKGTGHGF